MSATGRDAERRADDFYATPKWCTLAGLSLVEEINGPVLDPCCGKGAILDAVAEHVSGCNPAIQIAGFERDWKRAHAARGAGHDVCECDALLRKDWRLLGSYCDPTVVGRRPSLVVMNPPFGFGMDFLQRALLESPLVLSLHRQGFIASSRRAKFWQSHKACLGFLSRRPSFAIFLKCAAIDCGWSEWFETGAPSPETCPKCRAPARLKKTTSDAADYVWVLMGDQITQNTWVMLQ